MLQFLWKHAAQNASYCKNKTTQRRRCICMIPQLLSWLCQEGLAVKRNKWGMAVETCHVIVCIHQSLMMYQSLLNGKSPVCRHFCVLSLYVPYFLPHQQGWWGIVVILPGGRRAWTPEFLNWITRDQCDIGLWNSTPSTKNLKPFWVPVTLTSRSDEDVKFSEKSCECDKWRM